MLAERGNDYTQAVLSGWVANLATDVFLNDTPVLRSTASSASPATTDFNYQNNLALGAND